MAVGIDQGSRQNFLCNMIFGQVGQALFWLGSCNSCYSVIHVFFCKVKPLSIFTSGICTDGIPHGEVPAHSFLLDDAEMEIQAELESLLACNATWFLFCEMNSKNVFFCVGLVNIHCLS